MSPRWRHRQRATAAATSPRAYNPPPSGHALSPAVQADATVASLEARRERSELKRQLKHREITIGAILDRRHETVIARMRVFDLLSALPGLGKAKARQAMFDLRIAESRRVGGLGVRQVVSLRRRFEPPKMRKWSA
jgi:S13-like H2TH domain